MRNLLFLLVQVAGSTYLWCHQLFLPLFIRYTVVRESRRFKRFTDFSFRNSLMSLFTSFLNTLAWDLWPNIYSGPYTIPCLTLYTSLFSTISTINTFFITYNLISPSFLKCYHSNKYGISFIYVGVNKCLFPL